LSQVRSAKKTKSKKSDEQNKDEFVENLSVVTGSDVIMLQCESFEFPAAYSINSFGAVFNPST